MTLLAQLALRFLGVGCACFVATMVWIMADARTGMQAEAETSAMRVASALSRQPGLGSADSGDVVPGAAWRPTSVVLTILPGICVVIDLGREPPSRLCSGWEGSEDRRRFGFAPPSTACSMGLSRSAERSCSAIRKSEP